MVDGKGVNVVNEELDGSDADLSSTVMEVYDVLKPTMKSVLPGIQRSRSGPAGYCGVFGRGYI